MIKLQTKISELKNIKCETKNSLEDLASRVTIAKSRISELEDEV